MTEKEFRKLALAVPEAVEGSHGGHPDFRLGGRVFASLGAPKDDWGMVKLTPEQQSDYIGKSSAFKPCNGAWGRQGYTYVNLAAVTKAQVVPALAAAAQNVRESPSRKRLSKMKKA